MRCSEAREIVNSLMDGDNHPFKDDAMKHIPECRECRTWHESMILVIGALDTKSDDIPVVDLAPMVMSRLPARHPAFRNARESVWKPRRVLLWTAESWFAGAAMLVLAWILFQSWITAIDVNGIASEGYSSVRSLAVSFSDIAGISGTILKVISTLFYSHGGVNLAIALLALLFMFDGAIAAAVIAVLKRKRFPGTMMV